MITTRWTVKQTGCCSRRPDLLEIKAKLRSWQHTRINAGIYKEFTDKIIWNSLQTKRLQSKYLGSNNSKIDKDEVWCRAHTFSKIKTVHLHHWSPGSLPTNRHFYDGHWVWGSRAFCTWVKTVIVKTLWVDVCQMINILYIKKRDASRSAVCLVGVLKTWIPF